MKWKLCREKRAVARDRKAVKAGEFSRFVERAEEQKQKGILGNGSQCGSSQNADPAVYKGSQLVTEGIHKEGGSGETDKKKFERCGYIVSVGRNRRGREERRGEERREKRRGDQAYAPFGAGRETGHQVPVVAAKIKAIDIESLVNTLWREGKEGGEGDGRVNRKREREDFHCVSGVNGRP